MSRPITPIAGAHSTMLSPTTPSHADGTISYRPGFGSSKPTSYLSSAPVAASGFDHVDQLDHVDEGEHTIEPTHAQSPPNETSVLVQNNEVHDETLVSDTVHEDASPDIRRSDSRMSQSQYSQHTPSRAGTLKKKSSLKRVGSLGRSASRRSSYAGSARSVKIADKEDLGPVKENNSAFYCPVPTSGNPTELLATRFQAWRKVLKDLINYFHDMSRGYDSRSKSLSSASNIINSSSVPSNFLTSGGVGDALFVLRDFHKQATTEASKASRVQDEIVVQLTGLRSDLQQKIKEIKSLSGDFKNSVDKEQEGTKRAVNSLQEAIGSVDHDVAAASGKGDPFIVKMGVDRQLERQLEEENYLHRAYLNLESSGRELESIVVGEIQKAYNAFAQILRHEADGAYETAEKLKEGPLAMTKDHEWDSFTKNNPQMVDPRVAVRQVKQISYPGKDHPAAIEVKSGMLERKSKYLKNYTPGWYILSPTHLHEYKSADRIASQAPIMSLYLVEQKLGSFSEPGSSSHKFMLKGRQTGSMHRGHAWVFRAESHDTMMAWYSDIKELTEKKGEERNAFVRRQHARSLSSTQKPESIGEHSTDGMMEEDEADKVPYSSEQSVRGQSATREAIDPADGTVAVGGGVLGASAIDDMEDSRSEAGWRPPQRPSPGGRFPSDVNVARGLQAPHSPSSGDMSDQHDREVMMAASGLPGSNVPFSNSTERHSELQPQMMAHEAPTERMIGPESPTQNMKYEAPTQRIPSQAPSQRMLGNEMPGGARNASPAYATGNQTHSPPRPDSDYQYGDFRHAPASRATQPVQDAAATGSQYGEWMAPMAAGAGVGVGGAALGAVGAKHYYDRHDEKKRQEELERQQQDEMDRQQQERTAWEKSQVYDQPPSDAIENNQPIEAVDNVNRQMEASSAVPALGTSSPPILVDTAAPIDAPRSPSRSRGLTESTQATNTTAVSGVDARAPTDITSTSFAESGGSLSTVPTSVGGEVPISGGPTIGTIPVSQPTIVHPPWQYDTSVNPLTLGLKDAPPVDRVLMKDGSAGGRGVHGLLTHRPHPISAKSVQTISELHIPGEFPKAPEY